MSHGNISNRDYFIIQILFTYRGVRSPGRMVFSLFAFQIHLFHTIDSLPLADICVDSGIFGITRNQPVQQIVTSSCSIDIQTVATFTVVVFVVLTQFRLSFP